MIMATFNISKTFRHSLKITEKVSAVMRMFGLTVERLGKRTETLRCSLEINAGDIVCITGPSGAGKSVLLTEMESAVPECERINLNDVKLAGEQTLIDCIEGDFMSALKLLSIAGLSDVFCVLNQPANLSEGQKYRFRLAAALAAGKKFIFADEFCSNLDRITASVISYNIHKFAKKTGVTFILAASQDDMLADLSPDVLVVKELSGVTEVVYKFSHGGRREIKV